MHTRILLYCLLLTATPAWSPLCARPLTLYGLTTEHLTDPVGIDVPRPRLSWKLRGTGRNLAQSAYELRVATTPAFAKNDVVWTSGKVASDTSVLRTYGGPALASGRRYYWQVRAWDQQGKPTAWSVASYWEMGLLSAADWQARWIEPVQETAQDGPALMVRKAFVLPKQVARAYVTAHGLYQSVHGEIASGWARNDQQLTVTVTIPVNTTATITLPGARADAVQMAGRALAADKSLRNVRNEGNDVRLDVGSGHYTFVYTPRAP